jgi:hypothetical protein
MINTDILYEVINYSDNNTLRLTNNKFKTYFDDVHKTNTIDYYLTNTSTKRLVQHYLDNYKINYGDSYIKVYNKLVKLLSKFCKPSKFTAKYRTIMSFVQQIIKHSTYYNKDKALKNITKYNATDMLPIDMKMLNTLTKLHSIKWGIHGGFEEYSTYVQDHPDEDYRDETVIDDDDDSEDEDDDEFENLDLNACVYNLFKKHNIQTHDDLYKLYNMKAIDGNKFYIMYDFGDWRCHSVRILPIFMENDHVTYMDILDHVWPFASDCYRNVDEFEFYGWKGGVPVIKIKKIDNYST